MYGAEPRKLSIITSVRIKRVTVKRDSTVLLSLLLKKGEQKEVRYSNQGGKISRHEPMF